MTKKKQSEESRHPRSNATPNLLTPKPITAPTAAIIELSTEKPITVETKPRKNSAELTTVESLTDKSDVRTYISNVLMSSQIIVEGLHNERYKLSPEDAKEIEFVYQLRTKLSQYDDGVFEAGDLDRRKKGKINGISYDDIVLLHKSPTDREASIINKVLWATPDEFENIDLDELIYVRGLVDSKMFTPELGKRGVGRRTYHGFQALFKSMDSSVGDELFKKTREMSMNLGRVIYQKSQLENRDSNYGPLEAKNRIWAKASFAS